MRLHKSTCVFDRKMATLLKCLSDSDFSFRRVPEWVCLGMKSQTISGFLSAGFQTSGLQWTPVSSLSTSTAGGCPTRMGATDSRWPRAD